MARPDTPICRARSPSRLAVIALALVAGLSPANATAATLGFDAPGYPAPESAPNLRVTLRLSVNALECDGLVRIPESFATLSALGGSATAGEDFRAGDRRIPLGVTGTPPIFLERVIGDLIVNDSTTEEDESFELELAVSTVTAECLPNEAGAPPFELSLAAGPAATVTIMDDDLPEVSITEDVSMDEGDTGSTTPFNFSVTLDQAAERPVSVSYETADGTATAADGDYRPKSDTLTLMPGDMEETITVEVLGDTTVEGNETFFVILTGADIAGEVRRRGTIENDDVPGISIGDVSMDEGDAGSTAFEFAVTLDPPAARQVSVSYGTADGTASVVDRDYLEKNGTLTFAPGETEKTILVEVLGDTTVEDDETLFVILTVADITGETRAQGTIENDDTTEVFINDVEMPEGDAGSTAFEFTVTLERPADKEVSVSYETADGTAATAGDDYQPTSGTLTFSPGEVEMPIVVQVLGDTTVEDDETFFVILTGADVAGEKRGRGTILNDDPSPPGVSVSIGNVSGVEGDDASTTFEFKVTLEAPAARSVSVSYRTADGTARVAERDYLPASGTLTFFPGEREKTITVEVLGDTRLEQNESFFVVLTGADIAGEVRGRGTILNDEASLPEVSVSVGDASGPEGDAETTELDFLVTLDPPAARQVEVSYETADDTATVADGDYRETSGTLIFSPGQTEHAITVEVFGDRKAEKDETFLVVLTGAEGVAVADEPGVGTIENDDAFIDPETLAGLGETEASVAEAVNVVCPRDDISDDLRGICTDINELDAAEQAEALREIAPEEVAVEGTAATEAQATQLRNIGSRLAALRGGARRVAVQIAFQLDEIQVPGNVLASLLAPPPAEIDLPARVETALAGDPSAEEPEPRSAPSGGKDGRLGFFLNGAIAAGDRPGTHRESGFDFDTQGITAGVDYRFTPALFLGGAVGYLSTDAELAAEGGALEVEGRSLSVYGTFYRSQAYLGWILSYGRHDFNLERAIDFPDRGRLTARGEPEGDQLAFGLSGGYNAQRGPLTLGSFGSVDYLETDIDGYRERGAPGFNLAIDAQKIESLLATAGLQVTRAVSLRRGVVFPTLRLQYLHEFAADSLPIVARFIDDPGGTKFAVPTEDPDRDYFNVGVGISAVFRRGRQAFLFFDQDLDRQDLNIYMISFGLRFEI